MKARSPRSAVDLPSSGRAQAMPKDIAMFDPSANLGKAYEVDGGRHLFARACPVFLQIRTGTDQQAYTDPPIRAAAAPPEKLTKFTDLRFFRIAADRAIRRTSSKSRPSGSR